MKTEQEIRDKIKELEQDLKTTFDSTNRLIKQMVINNLKWVLGVYDK
jgi:hypothetical protein